MHEPLARLLSSCPSRHSSNYCSWSSTKTFLRRPNESKRGVVTIAAPADVHTHPSLSTLSHYLISLCCSVLLHHSWTCAPGSVFTHSRVTHLLNHFVINCGLSFSSHPHHGQIWPTAHFQKKLHKVLLGHRLGHTLPMATSVQRQQKCGCADKSPKYLFTNPLQKKLASSWCRHAS